MTFGERLKLKRIEKGFSQKDFATQIGLTKDLYNKYENDKNRPNFETITLICETLDISSDYLIGVSDDSTALNKATLNIPEAALVLKTELSKLDIDIEDGKELETILKFIDTNKEMLKILMKKDKE